MTSPIRTTRRGMHAVVVTVATTFLLGSIVPSAFAADPAPPDVEAAVPEIRPGETDKLVTELRSRIDELSAVNTELSDENSALHDENEQLADERDDLQQEVDTLTRDRDRLAGGLTVFDDLYDPLEADRKLLLDLRKPVEDMTRTEAEQHVKRIRDLAQASNPSALGRLADQLGDSAPAFLDWRETQYASTEEATLAFIDSGASEFTSTMEDFTNEFLLSVASRLDGLLTILDSAR